MSLSRRPEVAEPQQKKARLVGAEEEIPIPWRAVSAVLKAEVDALGRTLGTLEPSASVAGFTLQSLATVIRQAAPNLWALISMALEKPESRTTKTNQKLDTLLTFLFSSIAKFKNQRANRFSLFFGLYLVSKGTPNTVNTFSALAIRQASQSNQPSSAQVIEALQRAGLSDSKTSMSRWLEARAEKWVPNLHAWCPDREKMMVAYDNYQRNVRSRCIKKGSDGKFLIGTTRVFIKAISVDESLSRTASAKPLADVTVEDVRVSPCEVDARKTRNGLTSLSVPQILPDDQCRARQLGRLRLLVRRALVKLVPEYATVPQSEYLSFAHTSEIRMGKLLLEDETSLQGTTNILREMSKELGLKGERILTHGDQATVKAIVGAQQTLANEETFADRLANFVPVPGGFHFRWKFMRLVLDNWWGQQHLVGSFSHARVKLGRNRVDREAKTFSHAHEMLEDVLDAHLLALFWRVAGRHPADPADIDEKVSATGVDCLYLLLTRMCLPQVDLILAYLATASAPGPKPTPETFRASMVCACLVYVDAHRATKAGDGRAILDNERQSLVYFLGSNKSKNYKVTTFNDILQTLYLLPPYYGQLSIANRTVNMQGEKVF